MGGGKNKIRAAAVIAFNFAMCVLISAGVYVVSMIFAFGVWHCPPPHQCEDAVWSNLLIFAMWLSPLAFFPFGAFVSRPNFGVLTAQPLARNLMFLCFALFPLLALGGLIVYAFYS